MGGLGSMGTWVQRGLGGADLTHPSSAGAEVLGNWIYLALMEGYEAFATRPPEPPGAAQRPEDAGQDPEDAGGSRP
jgi:hypothetical protein